MADNPFVKPNKIRLDLVNPQPHPEKGWQVVVLDRVDENVETEYCIHGRVQCHKCLAWCLLGSETLKLVRSGSVVGICMPCARKLPSEAWSRRAGHIDDHKREDGPH